MREGWEYKKLGEVCNILNGYAFKSSKYTNSGTRIIRITNVQKGYVIDNDPKYYSDDDIKNLTQYSLREGDLVMSLTGNVGRVGMLQKSMLPAALNQRVACIRTKSDEISLNYLFHLFNSDVFERAAIRSARGIAQLNMSTEWLKEHTIPLPPKSTQLAIVSELDKIKELIRLKKEQLKDFDNLAQSIFYEMFGDPVENDKGWEVKTLGEMSTCITNGNTPKGGSLVYVDKGILFLRSQNVWKNRFDLEDVAYIDEATHQSMQRSSLHKNDILITKTGRINTENSSLGRTALYIGEDNTANINGHVYLVRLKKDVPAKYILYILISKSYYELIRKTCVGGIDKRQLNLNHIENFPIPNPPLEQQEVFVRCVEAIEHQKAEAQKAIADLETLLASRMQYWFE